MKSFLAKNGTPIIKWGLLPDNIFYEGFIPDNYELCVCPSNPYIILDIDRHGNIDGFDNIPIELKQELLNSFSYHTTNNGMHYWLLYTGNKTLMNKASGLGIDLRIGAKNGNSGGYVKWHPRNTLDIRDCIKDIKETSKSLNIWLEKLFANNTN